MILLFIDSATVSCEVNEAESNVIMQERLLYCVLNVFSLFHNSLVKIFSVGSELIKNKDRILHIDFSFFLEFLHSGHNLSGKSSNFKFLILPHVEKNTELLEMYMTFYPPMASCSLMLSVTNFSWTKIST
jgi:hypothetical protein